MDDRLNQYQRRQAKRQMDALTARAMGKAFLLTLLGFGVYYLLIRDALNKSMYQTVLDSGGRVTFDQVAWQRFTDFLLPAFITFFCISVVLGVIAMNRAEHQHDDFDFGDGSTIVHAGPASMISKPRNLARISPREFEEEVARLITMRTGCHTQVVGGSGDRGVDIKVYDANRRLVGVVQCKRYRPGKALPPMFVREMATVKQMHQVNIAYIATTAYFTRKSQEEARLLGVRLIDGRDLKHISRKATSPERPATRIPARIAPAPVRAIERHDPDVRFRRPMSEEERIQQQLDERRQRLNKF